MKNTEKIQVDLVAIVHRIFTDGKRKRGGADKILAYFSQKGKKVLLIEHPLSGLREKGDQRWNEVIISLIEKGEIKEISREKIKQKSIYLRWLSETIFNIWYIGKKVTAGQCFFCADALAGLTAVFFKKNNIIRYFHCVDYSQKRFDNFILNYIYKKIFSIVSNKFDLISVVSMRTKEELIRTGLNENKIFYLPNSPDFKSTKIKKRGNILIYTSGSIIEKYNYDLVLELLFKIRKYYPDIKLYAGGGKNVDQTYFKKIENRIKKYKLKDNINFTGFVEDKEIGLLLSRAKIGLSFYTDIVKPYTYYGDSLKIREYALYGVPTIADGNSATDIEMVQNKCGYIVKTLDEAVDKVRLLLDNKKYFTEYRNNCLTWAKKNDKQKLLKNLFNKIFSDEK